ncbi:hypothetical protein ABZ471_30335 [Streptomyces sp. NPDC005728]|uniref:hypothetical protein n=1 Tax=Streptomyces sp. NPDC005728 TaxID=3157054 RepID=UPI0033F82F8B
MSPSCCGRRRSTAALFAFGRFDTTAPLVSAPLTRMRGAVGPWAASYVVAGLFALATYGPRPAGLLLCAALLALGACASSGSFHPWPISMAPGSEPTRAAATADSTTGAGGFAGPSIGVGPASASATAVRPALAPGHALPGTPPGPLTCRQVRRQVAGAAALPR